MALELTAVEAKKPSRVIAPFITHLATPNDAAVFTFTSPHAGQYTITLIYNCASYSHESQKDSGELVISTRDQSLTFSLKLSRSGKLSSYELVEIGDISLPAGEVSLVIRPKGDSRLSTLRICAIHLIPTPNAAP